MITRLPKEITTQLPRIQKPGRYIGKEINSIKKENTSPGLRVVLCYPDIYEIGMSNLGLRILYESINRTRHFSCERVFSPWLDFERLLREKKIPLYSLETYTPLYKFDVVGFSIGYELLYTNILAVLDLGHISLFSKERGENEPIVIAGGPASYNPEPIADFIDVFLIGDGEIAIIEFLSMLLELQQKSKRYRLESLNSFDFTYIPSLYKTKRHNGYLISDVEKVVKRRIEPDLDVLPYPVKPIVPFIKIIQDRVAVEVNRGCLAGCRFCSAGFTYRPLRERSVEKVFEIVRYSLSNSGYDEVSLSSLSIGDYSDLYSLVKIITDSFSPDHVSISLPSLRVNSTNVDILQMIQRVRKSGLTFAIESADGEVRNRLNKVIDIDQLKSIIKRVSDLGWRLLKLYFMIGLPMAKNEVEQIAELVLSLLGISKKLSLNVNVSVFVPKPHTPFQCEKQIDIESAEKIIHELRRQFSHSKVKIKFQKPTMSFVEGILSRGDRRISKLVYEAFAQGERFSSWDEVFDIDIWKKGMAKLNIDERLYTDYRNNTDLFPWYFISSGVKDKFFSEERNKAQDGILTRNCLNGDCSNCGVCESGISNRTVTVPEMSDSQLKNFNIQINREKNKKQSQITEKILFQFIKTGLLRLLSHLDLMNLFIRIGRRTGVPFQYSQGLNPKPRIIIPFPLALGIGSDYELGEIFINQRINSEKFLEMYNEELPGELQIKNTQISNEKKSIAATDFFHDYLIESQKYKADEVLKTIVSIKEEVEFHDTAEGFYSFDRNSFQIRLKGNRSIKHVMKSDEIPFQKLSIKRTMIWKLKEGRLTTFLEQ